MKTIGLIGGMSWESSAEYYRIINESVRARLGGQHSAKSLMYSVDFHDIECLQHEGRWDEAAAVMIDAGQRLQRGGADFIVLCTNTMHKLASNIVENVTIPLIHIADATAERIQAAGLQRIGLLGTKFTMEEDFYKGRLTKEFGLDVIVPDEADRSVVHEVIYDELCQGKIVEESKRKYLDIMQSLAERGAEGFILGCTEIGLLIKVEDSKLPIFDTTRIHAEKAVELALGARGLGAQASPPAASDTSHLDISPLACVMDAIKPERRGPHIANAKSLFSLVSETRELENGYSFCFGSDAGVSPSLIEFIKLEKLCCPFLGFTIHVEPESGEILLMLTGGEGVKAFIQAEIAEIIGAPVRPTR